SREWWRHLSDENVWRRSGIGLAAAPLRPGSEALQSLGVGKADKDSRLRFRRANTQSLAASKLCMRRWRAKAGLAALPDRSAHKHDFAGGSWLKNFLVCARGLGEWQFLSNNRTQRT